MRTCAGRCLSLLAVALACGCVLPMAASAANDFLTYTKGIPGADTVMIADANGANPRAIYTPSPDGFMGPSLSPDGETVVMVGPQPEISTLPREDGTPAGTPNTIYSIPQGLVSGAFLGPDSRTIYFGQRATTTSDMDIMRIDRTGTGLLPVIGGPTDDSDFSLAANGQRAAFIRTERPPPSGAPVLRLMTSNGDGTNQRQISFSSGLPDGVGGAGAISPDGSKIAFVGKVRQGTSIPPQFQTEIFTVNFAGTGLTRLTNSTASEFQPAWSPDGAKIAFTSKPTASQPTTNIRTMNANGTGNVQIIGAGGTWVAQPKYRQARTTPNPEDLLALYAPALRYDEAGNMRLLAADSMTDNTDEDGQAPFDANTLCVLRNPCSWIASASPLDPKPDLNLGFLTNGSYPNGTAVSQTDYLDAEGDSNEKIDDAQSMFGNPGYRNLAYSRVVTDGGLTWLQYWFFYYFNDQNVAGVGAHEGDWEMIQIGVDSGGIPIKATYARHTDEEAATCPYTSVGKTIGASGTAVPTVYVAAGSQASYFAPGTYGRGADRPADNARGDSDEHDAVPFVIRGSTQTGTPSWVRWPGTWGGDDSPAGPLFQGSKSNSPAVFDAQARSCDAAGPAGLSGLGLGERSSRTRALVDTSDLPRPAVSAGLRDRRLTVSYRFADGASLDGVERVVVTVDAQGKRYPPLTTTHVLRGPAGTIRRRLPQGRGPYRVRVSAATETGAFGPAGPSVLVR